MDDIAREILTCLSVSVSSVSGVVYQAYLVGCIAMGVEWRQRPKVYEWAFRVIRGTSVAPDP